jgi:hypothetical protein
MKKRKIIGKKQQEKMNNLSPQQQKSIFGIFRAWEQYRG